MIIEFEQCIKEGIVCKVTPDKQRASDLIIESERKYDFLLKLVEAIGIDDDKANEYVESCYNILLFLIRAKMLIDGYNSSGVGAHEAEVAFSRLIGLSEKQVIFLDKLRYFRNGIMYYGKRFDKEYAQKVVKYTKETYSKLKDIVKQ